MATILINEVLEGRGDRFRNYVNLFILYTKLHVYVYFLGCGSMTLSSQNYQKDYKPLL